MADEEERLLNVNRTTSSPSSSSWPRDSSKTKSHYTRFITRNQGIITTVILCTMSIVNVTDRYVVGSVLIDIENYFKVSKSTAGLLQTFFLLTYMLFSTPNGYLGDRINRKYLLIASILIWIASTAGGSLVTESQFDLFVLSRCLFGVATASFETISMPILGDRFSHNRVSETFVQNLILRLLKKAKIFKGAQD
jgi:predicted MFS family arabinose efflux permease